MKKALSILLSTVFCASALAVAAPLSTNAALYKAGDADGNCKIDAVDSYLIKKSTIEDVTLTDGADVDRDGEVTSRDAFYLKASFSGILSLDDAFPEDYGKKCFAVAGNSISEYRIIVTNSDNANMVFAAQELQKYVSEGCGVRIETENLSLSQLSGEKKVIVLCEGEPDVYGTDGFKLSCKNGNLIIEAGAKRGCMYAVYALLEDYYGYRFYGYSHSEVLPESAADIPEGTEDVQIPTVNYRCNCIDPYHDAYVYSADLKRKLSGCTSQWSMLRPEYGYGVCRLFANAHSFDVFIPLPEYVRATNDPDDLYGLTDEDIEKSNQFVRCLSKQESFDICLKNMKKLIADRIEAGGVIGNDITEISCSYAADEQICVCRKCNKVSRTDKSASGILVQFVNKIDDALHEVYPDITLITNGYGTWRKPPAVSVLNPDVIVLYCWGGCAAHNIGSGQCTGRVINSDLGCNTVEEEYFRTWQEHCSRMYIWYYPTNIYYLLCPQPNFFKIYDDFMFFTSHGVEGFYVVGTSGSSFEDLDAYLACELMWDTQMTREQFEQKTKEYLKYYYGYGWIYIYEYMEMLREAGSINGCVLNDFEQPFDIYSESYFKENYPKMKELLLLAKEAADTDFRRQNVEKLSLHMNFLGLSATYESDYVNGSEAQRAEYAACWRSVYDTVNANGIRSSYDKVGISEPFTLDKNPMMTVYGISGHRYQH